MLFNIVIVRTQNKLILKNMQLCFSLNGAYYFFGHNATTAIGQVRKEKEKYSLTILSWLGGRDRLQNRSG